MDTRSFRALYQRAKRQSAVSLAAAKGLGLAILATILFLGITIFNQIFTPPPGFILKRRGVAAAENSGENMRSQSRLAREPVTRRLLTLTLDCFRPQKKSLVSSATMVRISGPICEIASPQQVKIVNSTNGFSATVFFVDRKNFTTDFIALEDGANEINFRVVKNDGKLERQKITIVRRR